MNSTLRSFSVLVASCLAAACVARATRSPDACRISGGQSAIARQYAPGAGGLRGRVLAAGSLVPLRNALIDVEPGAVRTTSDSAGRFHIPLSRGTYVLRIRLIGYQTAIDTISTPGFDGFDVTAVLVQPNPGLIGCTG